VKLLEHMMGPMIRVEVDHDAFATGRGTDSLHDLGVGRAALDQLDPRVVPHAVVDHGKVDVDGHHPPVDAHHLLDRGEEQRAAANVDPGLDDQVGLEIPSVREGGRRRLVFRIAFHRAAIGPCGQDVAPARGSDW
jgi:hypothetical protein